MFSDPCWNQHAPAVAFSTTYLSTLKLATPQDLAQPRYLFKDGKWQWV